MDRGKREPLVLPSFPDTGRESVFHCIALNFLIKIGLIPHLHSPFRVNELPWSPHSALNLKCSGFIIIFLQANLIKVSLTFLVMMIDRSRSFEDTFPHYIATSIPIEKNCFVGVSFHVTQYTSGKLLCSVFLLLGI
jgi:hypothetical protein